MTIEVFSAYDGVTGILLESQQWMDPAMRAAVDRLHPDPGLVSAFTFGWVEVDGSPREDGGGKGVRPALAGLAARLVGATAETAAPGAVAVEFVHAFSLVHDDIMDGDELRRHQTTAWKAYGVGAAVLAGDALLALALDTLVRAPGGAAAVRLLTGTLLDLVNGQAADTAFETRPWSGPESVQVAEYCAMAVGKTGSLLGCAAAVGTLLGGGSPETADTMNLLGRHLGLAYQAVDDLLGIWGDPAVTGKPVFGDLRRGKKTLPVVAALAAGAPGLAVLLESRPADEEGLRLAADLIAGGRAFTVALAERELAEALRLIAEIDGDSQVKEELTALARYLVDRRH
ncbi:MAG: polyprenyl synthetase family protein [Streptosporangiaceae bacterium]